MKLKNYFGMALICTCISLCNAGDPAEAERGWLEAAIAGATWIGKKVVQPTVDNVVVPAARATTQAAIATGKAAQSILEADVRRWERDIATEEALLTALEGGVTDDLNKINRAAGYDSFAPTHPYIRNLLEMKEHETYYRFTTNHPQQAVRAQIRGISNHIEEKIQEKKKLIARLKEELQEMKRNAAKANQNSWSTLKQGGSQALAITMMGAAQRRNRKAELEDEQPYVLEQVRATETVKQEYKTLNMRSEQAHQRRMMMLAGATALTLMGAYYLIPYLLKDRPMIIEPGDTSLLSWWEHIRGAKRPPSRAGEFHAPVALEEKLKRIIEEGRHAIERGQELTNLLFYGPPGTGKTMMARIIARESGAEYIIIRGAALEQLETAKVIGQLNAMFRFAQTSKRPVIIFFDEADAIFKPRTSPQATEKTIKATNTMLAQIDKPSNEHIQIILSSNVPDALDKAIRSRIGRKLLFSKPDEPTRAKLFEEYINKYIALRDYEVAQEVYDALNSFAVKTDGMVGRDIEQLALDARRELFHRGADELSADIMHDVIDTKINENADEGTYVY